MDSSNSNYYALLDALTKASSQNTELLKDAERQLKCWETQPGFYSTLLVSIDCGIFYNIHIYLLKLVTYSSFTY